jgi:hypothetical protein
MKTCNYCLKPAELIKHGEPGYPYPHVNYGPVWACRPCDAWINCYPGTENSMGALANADLRAAKHAAKAAFTLIWRAQMARDGCSKSQARKAGYRWLSEQLGLRYHQTAIGDFDLEQCQRVVEVCNNLTRSAP